MNNGEKFSVELELLTSKFKSKMESIKDSFKSLGQEAKKKIEPSIDSSQTFESIERIKSEFAELSETQQMKVSTEIGNETIKQTKEMIQMLSDTIADNKEIIEYGLKSPAWASWNTEQIKEAQIGLKQATIDVNMLDLSIKNLKKDSDSGITKNFKNFTESISKGFEKSVSKVKRFGLALFSIRSIWALVSRASSAYLSQDTELANKLQAVWMGLGSFFAPLIEKIAGFTIKAVNYLNVFIKALTGIDLLTKATTKSMDKLNKSSKSTSKTLAGFDEITNLNTETSGVSGIDTSWTDSFNNNDLKTEWVEKITSFGKWVRQNWQLVTAGLASVGGAILMLKINSVLASAGLTGMLAPIALVIGAIALLTAFFIDAYKTNDEFKEKVDNLAKKIKDTIIPIFEKFGDILKYLYENIIKPYLLPILGDLFDLIGWAIENIFAPLINYILDKVSKKLEVLKQVLDKLTDAWEWLQEKIQPVVDWWNKLKLDNKELFIDVKAKIDSAKKTISNFFSKMGSKIFSAVFPSLGTIGSVLKVIASLDTGTNYVPNDQLAMIHKGEAVIPKKFNSSEYFNSSSSKVESLLEELIVKVDNIEINPYTTVKDVGKASVNYINDTSRRLGRSVI